MVSPESVPGIWSPCRQAPIQGGYKVPCLRPGIQNPVREPTSEFGLEIAGSTLALEKNKASGSPLVTYNLDIPRADTPGFTSHRCGAGLDFFQVEEVPVAM
jgi:hypothetical protein